MFTGVCVYRRIEREKTSQINRNKDGRMVYVGHKYYVPFREFGLNQEETVFADVIRDPAER